MQGDLAWGRAMKFGPREKFTLYRDDGTAVPAIALVEVIAMDPFQEDHVKGTFFPLTIDKDGETFIGKRGERYYLAPPIRSSTLS
jgi:hypothetical protein